MSTAKPSVDHDINCKNKSHYRFLITDI